MQTREQKNAISRKNRYAAQSLAYQDFKANIVRWYAEAMEKKLTHSKLLEFRDQYMLKTARYQRTKLWVRHKLEGVWDTCFDLHWHSPNLEFCYLHPHSGTYRPSDEIIDLGLGSRVDTSTGGKYYRNSDGTFTVRFDV